MFTTLALTRPLIFFDLETTGISTTNDRIVELCAVKIFPDRTRTEFFRRFNPGIPIPANVTAVHGITDEMVKNEPLFKESVNEIQEFFEGCDVAGYNIMKFDVPLLVEELLRAGADCNPLESARIIDVQTIFHKREPRNLAAALKFYANEDLLNAHSAQADVDAAIKVLIGQFEKYDDLAASVEELADYVKDKNDILDYDRRFVRNDNGDIVFNFGQNKGKLAAKNHGMLQWIITKDFSSHTKYIAKKILQGTLQ